MAHLKFDPAKTARLDDPGRFETLIPEVMWEALGSPEPREIVEIGAGTGLFAARFAEMAPDATVYAADVAPAMLEWMRARRPEVAAGRVVPVLSEESRVPLPDASVDLVYMINVHHEFEDPAAIYAEALRLLRSGGQVMVADWAPGDSPMGPPQELRVDAEAPMALLRAAGCVDVREHEGLPWAWLVTARKP